MLWKLGSTDAPFRVPYPCWTHDGHTYSLGTPGHVSDTPIGVPNIFVGIFVREHSQTHRGHVLGYGKIEMLSSEVLNGVEFIVLKL